LALFSFNLGAKQAGRPSTRQLLGLGLLILGVQVLFAGCFALVLRPLITFVYGGDFAPAAIITLALLPGLVVDGVAYVAEGYLRGRGLPLATLPPRLLGAIVLLLLAFLLTPTMPLLGVPIAASAAHAVSGLGILWVTFRRHDDHVVEEADG
ncbi:MAG: hypothetical protein MI861_07755, partial [Pirellulales bacterium]|nr:hypothetical protein [Pirellulales bacterium]